MKIIISGTFEANGAKLTPDVSTTYDATDIVLQNFLLGEGEKDLDFLAGLIDSTKTAIFCKPDSVQKIYTIVTLACSVESFNDYAEKIHTGLLRIVVAGWEEIVKEIYPKDAVIKFQNVSIFNMKEKL